MGEPELDLVMRALAEENRRAILHVIRAEPLPVGQIANAVGLSQQATSHHLGVLRTAGVVEPTRDGTRHLYAVKSDALAAVRDYLDSFWPDKLRALKRAVEGNG